MFVSCLGMEEKYVLHPYWKRKFFYGLAELMKEDIPLIQPQSTMFPQGLLSKELIENQMNDINSIQNTQNGQFHSQLNTKESYNSIDMPYIELSSQRTEIKEHSTTESAVITLQYESIESNPMEINSKRNTTQEDIYPSTILINNELTNEIVGRKDGFLSSPYANELMDYYDTDRYCEITPCWYDSTQSGCDLHVENIVSSSLLFCIQVLDEFIACYYYVQRESWRVASCRIARYVFIRSWEEEYLNSKNQNRVSNGNYTNVEEFITNQKGCEGISDDVCYILMTYWKYYRSSYFHQQQLYFDDSHTILETKEANGIISCEEMNWSIGRSCFEVYGIKSSHVKYILAQEGDQGNESYRPMGTKLLQKHISILAERPSIRLEAIRYGIKYLEYLNNAEQRQVMSQLDWKIAFSAVEKYLKAWNSQVQIFPCGTFARGGIYGSVLDFLVVVPTTTVDHPSPYTEEEAFHSIIDVLISAQILSRQLMTKLSKQRVVCMTPFKTIQVLVDVKVYIEPKCWLALLYFTGPEHFVVSCFQQFLKISSFEGIKDTSFETLYEQVWSVQGESKIKTIQNDYDVFQLLGRQYLPPRLR